MNELILLNEWNIRRGLSLNIHNLEKEIETSFISFSEKFENQDSWSKLILNLRKKSEDHKYNYFSLIEQSGILNMNLETERADLDMSYLVLEYLTGWIHKFESDAIEQVAKLMIDYDKKYEFFKKVPKKYLKKNVFDITSKEINLIADDVIEVGEYYARGVIIPRDFGSVQFNKFYNCVPLISLIKGDNEFISFLHVFASTKTTRRADRQVERWMKRVAKLGEVTETIFAPKNLGGFGDTLYLNAPDYIREHSKKAIIYSRRMPELKGIVNKNGVYFQDCGYHLWGS